MKKSFILILGVLVLAIALFSFKSFDNQSVMRDACIYGTAYRGNSKIDGTVKVSTSWNGKEVFPKNGKYQLCLGSNPEQRITIYVDSDYYGKVYVDGNTQFNIRID